MQEAQMLGEVRGQAIVTLHAKVVDLEREIAAGKAVLERKREKKRAHKQHVLELEGALANAGIESRARAEKLERELQQCLVRVERVEAQVQALCNGGGAAGSSAAHLEAEIRNAKKQQETLEVELTLAMRVRFSRQYSVVAHIWAAWMLFDIV
jgi:predicted small integral membrane protein